VRRGAIVEFIWVEILTFVLSGFSDFKRSRNMRAGRLSFDYGAMLFLRRSHSCRFISAFETDP